MDFGMILAAGATIPPAAKVLAIVAVVYPLIQGIKKIPALTPYLKGWVAILLNVLLSAGGILIAVPADQLYTTNTLLALVTAVLGAAGVHGTVSAMSTPPEPPYIPPSVKALLLAALLIPFVSGCSSWERTAFQSLATAKATIDGAHTAYEVSAGLPGGSCATAPLGTACIPHTAGADAAITKAVQADTLAVSLMEQYEEDKAAGANANALGAAQTDVDNALASLATIEAEVKSLYGVKP